MENIRYKILLIEDNELDQRAFKRFVDNSDIPYDCIIASSVSEANNILKSDQFDAIISDHSLGDGTAFDILDLVKDTPTIVVTGAGDEETAVKAWKAGAYDYLIKDLDLNYLKANPKDTAALTDDFVLFVPIGFAKRLIDENDPAFHASNVDAVVGAHDGTGKQLELLFDNLVPDCVFDGYWNGFQVV